MSVLPADPAQGLTGKDFIEITMVLSPAAMKKALKGGKTLDTLGQISRDLELHGEDRFPHLKWSTEDELAADVDSEP